MHISRLAPLPAAAVVLGLALAPAAEARTVTVTSAARPVTLKAGDRLVVRVAENPSTGYSWKTVSKPAFLKRVSTAYEPDPAPDGTAGAGGRRTFTYVALRSGTGTLFLLYRRSFAPKDSPKAFKLKVTVRRAR